MYISSSTYVWSLKRIHLYRTQIMILIAITCVNQGVVKRLQFQCYFDYPQIRIDVDKNA